MATDIEMLLDEYASRSRDILGDNLVGVYLHGSYVMGCINPQKSDLDLIVIVNEKVGDAAKKEYMKMVTALSARGPAKGIEMSVVLREVCRPFVYPTPYELHYSIGHLERYLRDPAEYVRTMNGVDWDLAAHFTIIRARGKCLYGAPIDEVFGEVPRGDYMDSILRDIEDAEEEIAKYPLYLTLNLTRVLAYCEEGLVLSKKDGAEWAVNNIPREFLPLIRQALIEYTENAKTEYDAELAKKYAAYMLDRMGGEQDLEP